ncbi:hypothetical protein HYS00_00345 [Candidatus Microgenomates bacterium]|nr:hypothetical protein [Candidatus Microgenomates bacterium]
MAHPEGFLPSTQQPTRMEGGMRPPGSRAFPDASIAQLAEAIRADHEAIMRGGDPLKHLTDQLVVDVIFLQNHSLRQFQSPKNPSFRRGPM